MIIKNIIWSPLDQFEIVSYITLSIPIVGQNSISINNLNIYAIIIIILIFNLHFQSDNNYRLVPSHWSVAIESIYTSVHNTVQNQIGENNEIYTPFIYSLFLFILFANLNGNIPYGYTITTSAITSIGISVIIFLSVTIIALYLHNIKFFSYFVPEGTPLGLVFLLVLIELVSYLARAVSLGVRLFSNIVAGHTLLKILSTFLTQLFTSGVITSILTLIPFAIFVGLVGLEIAVSFIQSYVFIVLVCSYIKDAIQLH